MKTSIPASMQTDLDGGATHHCFCWLVVRLDGTIQGFTDHDKILNFGGIDFQANTGLTPTAVDQTMGLGVDNMDVMGILDSLTIDESAISANLYDDASITAYRVDWRDVNNRVIIMKGSIGAITRGNLGFSAEIRGISYLLNQKIGRSFLPVCDVDLGSPKCGINFAGSNHNGHNYSANAAVTGTLSNFSFTSTSAEVDDVPKDWWGRGLVTWTSGNNNGFEIEVLSHSRISNINTFILWEPMPFPIQIGDTFTANVGCSKSIFQCHGRFRNSINMRGFNLIPGSDAILRTATKQDENAGEPYASEVGK